MGKKFIKSHNIKTQYTEICDRGFEHLESFKEKHPELQLEDPSLKGNVCSDYFCEKPYWLPKDGVIYPLSGVSKLISGYNTNTYLPPNSWTKQEDDSTLYGSLNAQSITVRELGDRVVEGQRVLFDRWGFTTFEGFKTYSNVIDNLINKSRWKTEGWEKTNNISNYTVTPIVYEEEGNPFALNRDPIKSLSGVVLKISNNISGEKQGSYVKYISEPITLESGWYNASVYCRTQYTYCNLQGSSLNEYSYVRGPYFIANTGEVIEEKYFCNQDLEHSNSLFKINSDWNRLCNVSYLNTGTYQLVIEIPYEAILPHSYENPIIFVGIMVSKGKLTPPCDYQGMLLREEQKIQGIVEPIYSPLLINFNLNGGDIFTAINGNSDWTLIYSKYIEDNYLLGNKHIDVLGLHSWGYDKGKVIADNKEIEIEQDLSNYYNTWTVNIVRYLKEEDKLTITVYKDMNTYYSFYIENLYGEHEGKPSPLDLKCGGATYQLQLGGKNPLELYGDTFRDVMFYPKNLYIEDDKGISDIDRYFNILFTGKVIEIIDNDSKEYHSMIFGANIYSGELR